MKQSTHQFHERFFHISKCLAFNAVKTIQLKITIYTYIQIYMPISYVTRMTQNKNDPINSILPHGRVVDNNCCVVTSALGFQYLI